MERRWPPSGKEAAMSSLTDTELVPGVEGKPAPRSIDNPRRGTRGPKSGRLDRYGEADRALFPKIEEIMRTEHRSANAAALQLAEAGEVAGTGAAKSLAKRLAGRYLKYGQKKRTETR